MTTKIEPAPTAKPEPVQDLQELAGSIAYRARYLASLTVDYSPHVTAVVLTEAADALEAARARIAGQERLNKDLFDEREALQAQLAEKDKRIAEARAALQAVRDWDQRRGYIVPYVVRDQILALLKEQKA